MGNDYFRFKEFTVSQQRAAMRVCTDACLFGAWIAHKVDGRDISVLDIGAGTGLLSLMIAGKVSGTIDAVEIEAGAYLDTKHNFENSPWAAKMVAHHTSLHNYHPSHRFDLIVSNPPFFENDLRSPDEKRNTALHNDELSLIDIFQFASGFIHADGSLALLVGTRREGEVERCAAATGFYCRDKVKVSQTARHEPFRIMYHFGLKQEPVANSVERLVIKNEDNEYSAPFKNLLQDYYLYL